MRMIRQAATEADSVLWFERHPEIKSYPEFLVEIRSVTSKVTRPEHFFAAADAV